MKWPGRICSWESCTSRPERCRGVDGGGRKVREEGEGDEGDFQKQRCVFGFLLKGLSPTGMGLRLSAALLGAGSRWAARPGQAACRDGNSPCTPGVLTNAGLL